MKRLVCLIVLTAFSAPASARDSYFTFHGHRIHITSLRHCRSLSCVRLAISGLGHGRHDRDRNADVDTTPDRLSAPAPAVAPAQAAVPVAAPTLSVSPRAAAQRQPAPAPAQAQPAPVPGPAQPSALPPVIAQVPLMATRSPTTAAQPAPVSAPTLAAAAPQNLEPAGKLETTASMASAPPPAVGFEVRKPQPGSAPVKPVVQAPSATAQSSPNPAPQVASVSDDSDDDGTDTPLGDWQTEGKNGLVRIEACGASLCGYMLNASTLAKGETILVNMKPKSGMTWSGNIYSRSSGNIYYGTITIKEPNTLKVEACVLGKFFCSGNNWTRLERERSVRQHEIVISPPSSNRS